MINTYLTIIIPTYNRKALFARCIKSIKNVFGNNINMIVGDSSTNKYSYSILQQYQFNKIDIIEFDQSKSLLGDIYFTLIANVQTVYTLIVEDDDMLINSTLHNNCLYLLKNTGYDLVSFGSMSLNEHEKYLTFQTGHVYNKSAIPILWNGHFQFGQMYFKTCILKKSSSRWFSNKIHSFVQTSDEAIALISIYNSNKYYHDSRIGMLIGIQNDNLSWKNIEFTIFSSIKYIDELTAILHETDMWNINYKKIQFNEVKQLYSNLTFNNLYQNKNLNTIYNKVNNMILNNIDINIIYLYIKTMINMEIFK